MVIHLDNEKEQEDMKTFDEALDELVGFFGVERGSSDDRTLVFRALISLQALRFRFPSVEVRDARQLFVLRVRDADRLKLVRRERDEALSDARKARGQRDQALADVEAARVFYEPFAAAAHDRSSR